MKRSTRTAEILVSWRGCSRCVPCRDTEPRRPPTVRPAQRAVHAQILFSSGKTKLGLWFTLPRLLLAWVCTEATPLHNRPCWSSAIRSRSSCGGSTSTARAAAPLDTGGRLTAESDAPVVWVHGVTDQTSYARRLDPYAHDDLAPIARIHGIAGGASRRVRTTRSVVGEQNRTRRGFFQRDHPQPGPARPAHPIKSLSRSPASALDLYLMAHLSGRSVSRRSLRAHVAAALTSSSARTPPSASKVAANMAFQPSIVSASCRRFIARGRGLHYRTVTGCVATLPLPAAHRAVEPAARGIADRFYSQPRRWICWRTT